MKHQEAVEVDLNKAVLRVAVVLAVVPQVVETQAALLSPFTSQSLSAQPELLQAFPKPALPRPLAQVKVSQLVPRALQLEPRAPQLATEPRAASNHKYQSPLLLGRLVPSLDHQCTTLHYQQAQPPHHSPRALVYHTVLAERLSPSLQSQQALGSPLSLPAAVESSHPSLLQAQVSSLLG